MLNRAMTSTENNTAAESPTALTIYSTTWCGYCRRLKTQLDEAGIGYSEIDIEHLENLQADKQAHPNYPL